MLVLLTPSFAKEEDGVEWSVERPLGGADDYDASMESLVYRTGINPEFSEGTKHEVSQIENARDKIGDEEFIEQEMRRSHFQYEGGPKPKDVKIVTSFEEYDHGETRLDLRRREGLMICGIDPKETKETKDRDDTVSFEDLGGGVVRIGIHIADTSHFVFPGTAIDAEAFERQSTMYLPQHVVPMLPNILGAYVCSLDEHKSRLAQSIMITVYPDGRKEVWHGSTVIKSQKNFSYPEADKALLDSSHPFNTMLVGVKKFADEVRAARVLRGAIRFEEEPEMRMQRDAQGNMIVSPHTRAVTGFMIEDLALAASEAVGQLLIEGEEAGRSVVFERVHVPPPLDRLMRLIEDMWKYDERFAVRTKSTVGTNPTTALYWRRYKDAMGRTEDDPERKRALEKLDEERNAIVNHITERISNTIDPKARGFAEKMRGALRKISPPAYYSLQRGIGHAGLNIIPYIHFTSPIRRRPDQKAHVLRNMKLLFAPVTYDNEIVVGELEKEAEQANRMMRLIGQAERDAKHIVALHTLRETPSGTIFPDIKVDGYAPKGRGVYVSVPLPGGGWHRFVVSWETLIGPDVDPRESGALQTFRPGARITLQFEGIDFVNREALFAYSDKAQKLPATERNAGEPLTSSKPRRGGAYGKRSQRKRK